MGSNPALDLPRLQAAYAQVRDELLAERTPDGHWVGKLSSSALSTATAVSALAVVRRQVGWDKLASASAGPPHQGPTTVGRREPTTAARRCPSLVPPYETAELDELICRGVAYLVTQQNEDGGFGDTDLSHSNIATAMLVVAALQLAEVAEEHAELLARANVYIDAQGRMRGLRERYGIDKTFVVPIMTNLAIAELVEWREIDALPFELACVPQALYRFVGMPVVSYAIPALVAIGQAQFHHAPPRNPVTRLIRWLSISRSLQVLRRMQPESGGYLEATPLTSFVVMSLAGSKVQGPRSKVQSPFADEVIREGVRFLANSIRPDGSWPIDTNLATWNTTLAINALAGAGEDVAAMLNVGDETVRSASDAYMRGSLVTKVEAKQGNVLAWLLSCQHLKQHPFTGAFPGGFGWSDLSGAVPDADDTPGAVLAMGALVPLDQRQPGFRRNLIGNAILFSALGWLTSLQNRDGGWPTFCRGWGKLPFDRSGTDLTAHVLRSIAVTGQRFEAVGDDRSAQGLKKILARISPRAEAFIRNHQHADGSWSPLWFGNQDHPEEDNPVYGTAKVLMAYRDLDSMESQEAQRGVAWLLANQNTDGGWGSGVWKKARKLTKIGNELNPKSQIPKLSSSVEETALAVEALLAACPLNPEPRTLNPVTAAVESGLNWLLDRVERGEHRQPAPIGFYFAKLWYYESLYPLTFTVAALGCAYRQFARTAPVSSPARPTDSPAGPPDFARA